eukprot:527344_1
MSLHVIFLCWLFTTPYTLVNSVNASCNVEPNHNSKRRSTGDLINGYNDVLGPIINLTYFDTALISMSKKMYIGAMRHPGGTVAMYWSMENASYVQPCKTPQYNYCSWQQRVQKLPYQTFSPSNFSKGIGSLSSSIVYDLNVLTLSNQTMFNQIDLLTNQIGIDNIYYLELGNELYFNFPNSSIYMQKMLPLISYIRSKNLPHAKICVVGQTSTLNVNTIWDIDLIPYSKYFDAVSFHEYSLTPSMVVNMDLDQQYSFISIYGIAVIPQYIEYIKNKFGENKDLWITEYDVYIATYGQNITFMYSVIHAMFLTSYTIGAICDNTNSLKLLMHTMYGEQAGTNWYPTVSATYLSGIADDYNDVTFDINAQIRAQLSWISTVQNNQMYCLDVDNGSCPSLKIVVRNQKNLMCINGAYFDNDSNVNSLGFVLLNSCNDRIDIEFTLNMKVKRISDVILQMWQYSSNQYGGNNAKFSDCGNNDIWDKSCAVIQPMVSTLNISQNDNIINLSIKPLSLILAATK